MSFIESPRFPDRISYDAISGVRFDTEIATSRGGLETRNKNWSGGRKYFNVPLKSRKTAEAQDLNSWIWVTAGAFGGFRIRDWIDYQAVNAPAIALTATTFQMHKRYTVGSNTADRKIKKPVSGAVLLYVGAALVATGFTIDYTTGIITFSSAPGAAVTWSGEFDVPVRFVADELAWRVFDRQQNGGQHFYDAENLELIEDRNA